MNEFIEKLIGRLEELKTFKLNLADAMSELMKKDRLDNYISKEEVISIINQLAEEYNNEPVKGDLISRSALIDVLNAERKQDRSKAYGEHECDLIAGTIAMCTDFVKAMPTAYNDGWIPCSERLPEITEGTECFKQSKCCLTTLKWWDGDMTESIGWYNQSRVWNEDSKNCKVVAWQPLPAPYQPKGE